MPSSQGITLQPTLKSMFREHLDNPTTVVGSLGIPLEVPVGDLEAFVELVGVELIGREDSECLWVHLDNFGNVGPDSFCQPNVSLRQSRELTPSCWRWICRRDGRNPSSLVFREG